MFTQLKNDGSQHSGKMSTCAKNDIIIINFNKMVTKWENQEKRKHLVILDQFTVWTPSIAKYYVNTNFGHPLNELFSDDF